MLNNIKKNGSSIKSEYLEIILEFAEMFSGYNMIQPSDIKVLGKLLMHEDPLIVSQT